MATDDSHPHHAAGPDLQALRALILPRLVPETTAFRMGITRHVIGAGHALFRQGDARDCAYLIDSGEIHILDDHNRLLCKLGPGEIFGEMALIDDGPRSASAVSGTLSTVYMIPRGAMQSRLGGLDPLLSLLIGLLVERYRAARVIQPESIRQEGEDDLIRKLNRGRRISDDLAGLADIGAQKSVALKELRMEQELRRAVDHGEFVPVLQPILRLPARSLVGFEALIRWQHPEKGMLNPDQFIPIAERTGTIHLLDRAMLRAICALGPGLIGGCDRLPEDFFISVNLSGVNFEDLDVLDWVRAALVDSEMPPRNLKLEITESALIADPDRAEQILRGIRALGVSVALDDFGTGYSSLGYLHRFPIDSLKIDRSFVMRLHDEPKSIDIVRAIVGLARNFRLNVIAEGIETDTDESLLNDLGCDMGQGYLFGKPAPVDAARDFMAKNLSA